jgi:hypothetical protein
MRHGIRRVGRRFGQVEGEWQVLLELRLHERLVVREDEPAVVASLLEFGSPRQRAGLGVRVVVRRPVGDVEVSPYAGVEARDSRVGVCAGVRDEERVVGRRRLQLPPVRVEKQRAV